MKIEQIAVDKQAFKPVTLQVTFETRDELVAVRSLFGGLSDIVIKEAVAKSLFPQANTELALAFEYRMHHKLCELVGE